MDRITMDIELCNDAIDKVMTSNPPHVLDLACASPELRQAFLRLARRSTGGRCTTSLFRERDTRLVHSELERSALQLRHARPRVQVQWLLTCTLVTSVPLLPALHSLGAILKHASSDDDDRLGWMALVTGLTGAVAVELMAMTRSAATRSASIPDPVLDVIAAYILAVALIGGRCAW